MAYVAISNQLLSDVVNKINHMKDQERETIKPPAVTEMRVDPDDALATQLIWGEHAELKDKIPETWKTNTAKLVMQYRVKGENDYNTAFFTLICTQTEGFQAPRTTNISYYGMDVKFDTEEACPPIMAEVIEYTKQVTEVDSRWKKVKVQVQEFLNNCKSLNEALKLWPQLEIYIPKQYLERMYKNSAAAKKSAEENAALKALQSIDTDFVVATAVGARLAVAAAGRTV